jgi:4-amino-4-deoxy-L-arabinose transferase-like glycosyltransferase
MDGVRREMQPGRAWAVAGLAMLALLLLARLSSFGIWDPWELSAADAARRLAEGELQRAPHAGVWVVSRGFAWLGVDEWSGRAPVALLGLLAAALCYALVSRFAGRRAGLYALVIAGTSPLFLFNARTMLGEAPSFALQAAIALSACLAAFDDDAPRSRRLAWLGIALVTTVLAVLGRGALLGALPPVAAAAAVAVADGRLRQQERDPVGALTAYTLVGLTAMFVIAIAHAVQLDAASYSPWLGGEPQGGQPPRFDAVIERVYHAFAPWSALLPLALARLPMMPTLPEDAGPKMRELRDERRLRSLVLLWAAVGYGAHTLYVSRYGDAVAYLPLVAIAAAVAMLLRDIERSRMGQWPAAIGGTMLASLLIREYSLFPDSPVQGMAIAEFEVPEVFNPKRVWGALLGLFATMVALSFGAGASPSLRDASLRAPYRFLRDTWRRSLGHKLWLLCGAAVMLLLIVFGVSTLVGSGHSVQARKWGKRLLLVPVILPVAVLGVQLLLKLFAGERGRMLPLLAAGALTGAYAAQGFMPALSAHFSPREVYETYNELAADDEPLGEYKAGSRAAAYYAEGEVHDIDTVNGLVRFLRKGPGGGGEAKGRRWAVLPNEELAAVDRMFRRTEGRHLFVADARSGRVLLATNRPIDGREDENFLADRVLEAAPEDIDHRVDANLDDRVRLLGYDLKLPHDGHVGAGEKFEITWYWESLARMTGSWRVFVHIDGSGQRIHGDHDPIDGKYPVRLWDRGDVIVDHQVLEVPANYRPGPFTIYVGFYAGEKRLEVIEGPEDDANRVKAGVLQIR